MVGSIPGSFLASFGSWVGSCSNISCTRNESPYVPQPHDRNSLLLSDLNSDTLLQLIVGEREADVRSAIL